jgi:GT2 family glycosyltransferase
LTLGIQSVLYQNDLEDIDRALASIARAADLAIAGGACLSVTVFYGDSSASPCLTKADLLSLSARHNWAVQIEYDFFDGNLGSARGHNRLAEANNADILLIQNPDVIVAPRLFEVMLGEFAKPGTGMVEAKQLPIEHPKDYDIRTGETCWATTACAMIPSSLFRQLNGFDADSFFLYCDDVDFSWRVRLAGFKVIFQPAAVVFHDKRLGDDGGWQPSGAEKYYSAEAALLMTYKWSRPDLTKLCLEEFKRSNEEHLQRAATEFERRQTEGDLPEQIDPGHRIGKFINGMYAQHRFPL